MNGTRFSLHLYGWLCVLLAAIFYSNFRSDTVLAQYLGFLHLAELSTLSLPLFIHHHLPSFLQAAFVGYLACWVIKPSAHKPLYVATLALMTAAALECLQTTTLLPGTFDFLDLLAIVIASGLTFYVATWQISIAPTSTKMNRLFVLPIFAGACLVSMGCYDGCDPDEFTCVEPVTLTWAELRADIEPSSGNATSLTAAGNIYVKDNYLFVIDNYRGVHIFDKTNKQNPLRIVFIPVQGALTLSIVGDLIYINSFTDFLVINYQKILDGEFDQSHVSRQQDVFLPPAYSSFLPNDYAIEGEAEDYADFIVKESNGIRSTPKTGFIIGYKDSDNTAVLYGEYDNTDSSDTSEDE